MENKKIDAPDFRKKKIKCTYQMQELYSKDLNRISKAINMSSPELR